MSDKSEQSKSPKKAVLLINLGTPKSYQVKDVRRFLKEFLSDRRVIEASPLIWQPILRLFILPFRSPKTAMLYQKIWLKDKNSSPLMHYTNAQAQRLSQVMEGNVLVDFAMRYGEPSIKKKLKSLTLLGVTEIKFLPLYPQYSATTIASIFDEVFDVFKSMRYQPNIICIAPYYKHRSYISALKQSVLNYLTTIQFKPDVLLLSFHGIPLECIQKGDPYRIHSQKTYELLKDELYEINIDIQMSFQSRFGPKEWLKPYTSDVLLRFAKEGKKNVLIMTPGFASDCLETLEELDETERENFIHAGGENYAVIPCLNDSDIHIKMLKTLIDEK